MTTEKSKRGRPRTNPDGSVHVVSAGMTREEKQRIVDASIAAGYRGNLSAYLRSVLLGAS